MKYSLILFAGCFTIIGCQSKSSKVTNNLDHPAAYVYDPHSYAQPNKAVVKHLNLELEVSFEKEQLSGIATWEIQTASGADTIIFDTHHLIIDKVLSGSSDEPIKFLLGPYNEILGQPLYIPLNRDVSSIRIYYHTTPESAALQWLKPEQTAGKKHPFLYTQSQAILARSWVPVQDSPGIRFTYQARVKTPRGYLALMSARNPQKINPNGIYQFEQSKPIPAYLLALSVGVLEFKKLGERCGVYAEPELLNQAAFELEDVEKMLIAAEKLYGPYVWERYDVLVLPPAFPFGGMENPMLTFATPTILAGDKSLISLIAHEMAHSWSGNLVTNATWNDFWLNEGFTVYFERRIMESLYGKEYADMLAVLGHQDLINTIEQLKNSDKWQDTRLKLTLDGHDPDDGVSDIAYEKGYALLVSLEKRVGRKRWDTFLNRWFTEHAFTSVTTEQFIEFVHKHLFRKGSDWDKKSHFHEWVYEPGLPANYQPPTSVRLDSTVAEALAFLKGKPATALAVKNWTSHEWQYFLRQIKEQLSAYQMAELDQAFHFTTTGNSEIAVLWFEAAILHHYTPAYPAIEAFLKQVGRRKFLVPLYTAMIKSTDWQNRVKELYHHARKNYHAVSRKTIDELLQI
ncbi:MAG: M1 family metallopeptidase [Flavobacteriales bacterium]|nr:M1 family metallopeptidase [Flavobacteriales bacterium]